METAFFKVFVNQSIQLIKEYLNSNNNNFKSYLKKC